MRNLYRMTSNVEGMRRLIKVTGDAPDLPLHPEIYPKPKAPIILADATGERRIEIAGWRISCPAASRGPVTNIRNLSSSFGRAALTRPERRCLVIADELMRIAPAALGRSDD